MADNEALRLEKFPEGEALPFFYSWKIYSFRPKRFPPAATKSPLTLKAYV